MAPLQEVCCARLARAHLAALAPVRCASEVEALVEGEDLWLRWPPGSQDMLRLVLPLPGVELFVQREGRWYRLGSRLPAAGPPSGAAQRLDQLIVPEPVQPVTPASQVVVPLQLRLVRDQSLRLPSALETTLDVLAQWADTAPTSRITELRAAWSGRRVVLLGSRLPLLPGSTRCWGRRLLTPLGFRPDPHWPERALLEAFVVPAEDLALLSLTGLEVLPAAAFQPLTRAGVRLACREFAP